MLMLFPGTGWEPLKTITSRQNSFVARFRAAAVRRAAATPMLLDGVHLIADALEARLKIVALAFTERFPLGSIEAVVSRARAAGAETCAVASSVMEAMSPVRSPSGVVALAEPPAWTLDSVVGAARPLVVAAMDVQDPGNVGAIVRSAEAGGATGVALCGASADPFGWKALRGSMGSALRLPVVSTDLDMLVTSVRNRAALIVATVPRGGLPPDQVDLKGPVVLLLGGEGPGLPAPVVDGADALISVPMRPPVESLNVAVATALLVYEASRQRGEWIHGNR